MNAKATNGATALYVAIEGGRLEVVRELLKNINVDVNVQHNDGTTALYIATQKGHLEVVRELLQHDNVYVNIKCNAGATALDAALKFERDDILQYLLERQISQDRTSLCNVMSTASADPVELSSHYIQQCTTLCELGSGAFGQLSLVEDKQLQKRFAVKKIKLSQLDQDAIEGIRRSFQREISVRSDLSIALLVMSHFLPITHELMNNDFSSHDENANTSILKGPQAISASQHNRLVRIQFKHRVCATVSGL